VRALPRYGSVGQEMVTLIKSTYLSRRQSQLVVLKDSDDSHVRQRLKVRDAIAINPPLVTERSVDGAIIQRQKHC